MTKSYKEKEAIEYFNNNFGIQKTRVPYYIDNRNYFIAILYDVFRRTEDQISTLVGLDRSTVSLSKDRAYEYLVANPDKKFIANTQNFVNKFPIDFSTSYNKNRNRVLTKEPMNIYFRNLITRFHSYGRSEEDIKKAINQELELLFNKKEDE
jgi:hypothetical protein